MILVFTLCWYNLIWCSWMLSSQTRACCVIVSTVAVDKNKLFRQAAVCRTEWSWLLHIQPLAVCNPAAVCIELTQQEHWFYKYPALVGSTAGRHLCICVHRANAFHRLNWFLFFSGPFCHIVKQHIEHTGDLNWILFTLNSILLQILFMWLFQIKVMVALGEAK